MAQEIVNRGEMDVDLPDERRIEENRFQFDDHVAAQFLRCRRWTLRYPRGPCYLSSIAPTPFDMEIRFHPHALERLDERGTTEGEVAATVEAGERFEAKFGRIGFRRNFAFDGE